MSAQYRGLHCPLHPGQSIVSNLLYEFAHHRSLAASAAPDMASNELGPGSIQAVPLGAEGDPAGNRTEENAPV